MEEKMFIQVILPLKLDWRPFYSVSRELVEKEYAAHPDLFTVQDSDNQTTSGHLPAADSSGPENLSYLLPAENAGTRILLKKGTRVRVTFARHSYIGVVTEPDATPPERLSRILGITEIASDLEPISREELELWEFLSEYYLCSIGEVYKTAYPGIKIRQEQIAARTQERENVRITKAVEMLDRKVGRLTERIQKRQEALETARKESRILLLKEEIRDLEIQVRKAEEEKRRVLENQTGSLPSGTPTTGASIQLSPAQTEAYEKIRKAFDHNKIVLLNGVTGSGKTEIYIRLAEETLEQGRNVLYLVPEILMGNQLAHRLKQVFGEKLLSFNSSQTTAERYRIAEKILALRPVTSPREDHCKDVDRRSEGGYILMGTRSAIFLPHQNLGLIIVDEEHDTSYKQQDSNPRYNGRDVAVVMAQIFHSRILLGSATPSLESLYNCEKGRYEEVYLAEKYYEAESADVRIIDTIAERRKRGMRGLFSLKLIEEINRTLDAGEQVVILRSRRAYSPVVQCDQCGHIPHCPHCNVTLSYHKSTGRLVCHHCGYSEAYDGVCPACKGHLEPMGSGTQKVEEEAKALFPDAVIARLDSDTITSRSFLTQTTEAFYQGKINVLIGTQIVAKGLDFPNLSLVVMLQADAMLGIEDFRADERALQLLEQFRGRCARRSKKGRFIIQTSQPEHPIYRQIQGQNDQDQNLISTFLEERRLFNYPPYARAVSIILRDNNESRLQKMADELYIYICKSYGMIPESGLAGTQNESIQIIPPFPPVIDKISNEFIRHIRLSLHRDGALARNKALLHRTLSRFEVEKRYPGHITTDVDPI